MNDNNVIWTEENQELINRALNDALYEKMKAEQGKYRQWLLQQPPRVVLDKSYRYHVREDILCAMDDGNLPPLQAATLLECDCPLELTAETFVEEGSYLDLTMDALDKTATRIREEESKMEELPVQQKIHYPLEEQINDCYEYLGLPHKDAAEMSEEELGEAESYLETEFIWVSDPRYAQQIPKHIGTGGLVPDTLARREELERDDPGVTEEAAYPDESPCQRM